MVFLDLLSGGLAGVISRTGVAPLELWKIQSQASYMPNASFKQVLNKEGIRYLWKGNLTNCIRIAPQTAINFAVFDKSKQYIHTPYKDLNHLICGGLAGSCAMATIYPLETIRSRLSLQTNKNHYNGIYDCYKKITYREMYKGLGTSLLGITPYMAFSFTFYHKLKEYFIDYPPHINKLLSGGFAAVGAVTITYPTDLVRRQLQLQGFDKHVPKYNGIIDCVRKLVKTQGIKGLYRGMIPCYVTIFPKFALQFWSYEVINSNLKKSL
tara:strand:+ start:160 stop:960 length:801 start_codon:yes stop_codon:yes gene_type:complete